jgi:ribonuclease D
MQQHNDFIWIENDLEFSQLCEKFSNKKWLTLDTEFIRETTYYAIPGLLQFSDGKNNWLVDPLGINNWVHFSELLESDIIWVMHACSEDIEVLHQLTATTPKNLFDTQVAAHFVGLGQSLGYQKLINELCDILLEKGESRTNWLTRPLTEKQLNYATDDVHYLAIGWKILQQQLIDKNLYEYFQQDMNKLTDWQPVDAKNVYKKVKLCWTLSEQSEVNRLQAISEWREKTAQLKNRPKRRILSDETLIEIAKNGPQTVQEFTSMNILNPRQIAAIGSAVLEVIATTEEQNQDYPAVRRSLEVAGSKNLIKQWKSCASEIAEINRLPATILFNNGLLETIFKYYLQLSKDQPKMWSGWREKLLSTPLLEILKQQNML